MEKIKELINRNYHTRGKVKTLYPVVYDAAENWRLKNRLGVFYGRFILSNEAEVTIKVNGQSMKINKDFTSEILFEELLSISGLYQAKSDIIDFSETDLFNNNTYLKMAVSPEVIVFKTLTNQIVKNVPVEKIGAVAGVGSIKQIPTSEYEILIDSNSKLYDFVPASEGEEVEREIDQKIDFLTGQFSFDGYIEIRLEGLRRTFYKNGVFVFDIPNVALNQLYMTPFGQLTFNMGGFQNAPLKYYFDKDLNCYSYQPAQPAGYEIEESFQIQNYISFETISGKIYKLTNEAGLIRLFYFQNEQWINIFNSPAVLGQFGLYTVKKIPSEAIYFNAQNRELLATPGGLNFTEFPVVNCSLYDIPYIHAKLKSRVNDFPVLIGIHNNQEFELHVCGSGAVRKDYPEFSFIGETEVNADFGSIYDQINALGMVCSPAIEAVIIEGKIQANGNFIEILQEPSVEYVPTSVNDKAPIRYTSKNNYFQFNSLVKILVSPAGDGFINVKCININSLIPELIADTTFPVNGLVYETVYYRLEFLTAVPVVSTEFLIDGNSNIYLRTSSQTSELINFPFGKLTINPSFFQENQYAFLKIRKDLGTYFITLENENKDELDSIQTTNGLINSAFGLFTIDIQKPIDSSILFCIDSEKNLYLVSYPSVEKTAEADWFNFESISEGQRGITLIQVTKSNGAYVGGVRFTHDNGVEGVGYGVGTMIPYGIFTPGQLTPVQKNWYPAVVPYDIVATITNWDYLNSLPNGNHTIYLNDDNIENEYLPERDEFVKYGSVNDDFDDNVMVEISEWSHLPTDLYFLSIERVDAGTNQYRIQTSVIRDKILIDVQSSIRVWNEGNRIFSGGKYYTLNHHFDYLYEVVFDNQAYVYDYPGITDSVDFETESNGLFNYFTYKKTNGEHQLTMLLNDFTEDVWERSTTPSNIILGKEFNYLELEQRAAGNYFTAIERDNRLYKISKGVVQKTCFSYVNAPGDMIIAVVNAHGSPGMIDVFRQHMMGTNYFNRYWKQEGFQVGDTIDGLTITEVLAKGLYYYSQSTNQFYNAVPGYLYLKEEVEYLENGEIRRLDEGWYPKPSVFVYSSEPQLSLLTEPITAENVVYVPKMKVENLPVVKELIIADKPYSTSSETVFQEKILKNATIVEAQPEIYTRLKSVQIVVEGEHDESIDPIMENEVLNVFQFNGYYGEFE